MTVAVPDPSIAVIDSRRSAAISNYGPQALRITSRYTPRATSVPGSGRAGVAAAGAPLLEWIISKSRGGPEAMTVGINPRKVHVQGDCAHRNAPGSP